jgi:hypothetical protein
MRQSAAFRRQRLAGSWNFTVGSAFGDAGKVQAVSMTNLDDDLTTIGFRVKQREVTPWRAVRIRRPAGCLTSDVAQEPSRSPVLLAWRELLRHNPGPSPYRISRAG